MLIPKVIIGFVSAAVLHVLLVQTGHTQPSFNLNYSLKEDLVHSQVRALHQDKQGYLWFGTQGGLSRFDGLQFTNFTIDDGLVDNFINGFTEDHQGRLWIATNKGISMYDGSSFTSLTTADGLIENHVNTLYGMPSGDVLIGYRSGISLYDGSKIRHVDVEAFSSPDVLSFHSDNDGHLWAGTTNGLCVLKKRKTTCYTVDDGLPHPVIQDVLIDSQERIWVATPGGVGLAFPDRKEVQFELLNGFSPADTRTLLEDRYGNIWIGTSGGVYLINPQLEVTQVWEDKIWLGRTLLEDREGSIWTEAMGLGVGQFTRTAFLHKSARLGLPEDVYLSVYEASDGTRWFGSVLNGLFRLEKDQLTHFNPVDWPDLTHIRSIRSAPDGLLWMGGQSGIMKYDGTTFQPVLQPDGSRIPYTNSVLPDKDGAVWVGHVMGMHVIQDNIVRPLKFFLPDIPHTVHTLELHNDRVWIGTSYGLAYVRQDTIYHVTSLPQTPVSSIEPDNDGKLWIGTLGNGVFRFDPQSETVVDTLSTKHGLTSGMIFFTRFDQNNDLWIGTGKGVSRLEMAPYRDSDVKYIQSFGRDDGVIGVETNKNAVDIDEQGRLWFGTLKGVIQHDATARPENNVPPPVYLTKVLLNLDTLSPDRQQQPGQPVSFSHTENHLAFEFQALSFVAPEDLTYRYRLSGLDSGWSPPTSNPSVAYSNLPPGSYTFSVRARNSDGVWSAEDASYDFTITPPFWDMAWFKILCVVGVFGLIGGITQIRTNTINKKRKKLEALVAQRTKELEATHSALLLARENALQAAVTRSDFLSMLTHELRTPLNGVLGMAQLLKYTELDEEQSECTHTILDSGNLMLDVVETLLSYADLTAGNRVLSMGPVSVLDILDTSIQAVQSQAVHKHIEIQHRIDSSIPQEITTDRKHFQLVIKHLLSNACKCATQGPVILDASVQITAPGASHSDNIVISVYDTTDGIDYTKTKQLFAEMDEENILLKNKLTYVDLVLARQVSALLGGMLTVEKQPEIGTLVRFSLPLERALVSL